MKLSKRQDIDAPISVVFAELTDFEGWERAALRRGAEVRRTDHLGRIGPGLSWDVRFSYRGKRRDLSLRLDRLDAPEHIGFSGSGPSVEGALSVELLEMAPKRTRMTVQMELKPRTIVARLFLQSLRLARSKVEDKFKGRVAQFAAEVENRQRVRAPG